MGGCGLHRGAEQRPESAGCGCLRGAGPWQRGRQCTPLCNGCSGSQHAAQHDASAAKGRQLKVTCCPAAPPPPAPARTGALPERGVLLAQLLVDLHVAACLAHHPHGGALHRLTAQRAQHERVIAAALHPVGQLPRAAGEGAPGWEANAAGTARPQSDEGRYKGSERRGRQALARMPRLATPGAAHRCALGL